MGKTVLPTAAVLAVTAAMMLVTVLATLAALATPAYPQVVSEDLAADEDGNLVGPLPPDYEVDENGFLIIGGDVLVPCSDIGKPSDSFGAGGVAPKVEAEIEQKRRESIRACRSAGLATAGDLPASASASSSASAPSDASTAASSATATGSAAPSSSAANADTVLPDTGGPALPSPLLPAAAVLLSAGGLLALRTRR